MQLLRSAAYKAWRVVPSPLRSSTRRMVGRTAVEDIVPDDVQDAQRAAGFDTATPDTLNGLIRAFKIAPANGDYFEFGMFKGYTFWFAQRLAAFHGRDAMRFFGFDSFAGLPAI